MSRAVRPAYAPAPSVVPSTHRVALSRVLSVAVALSGGWYLSWRLSTVTGTGIVGGVLLAAELLSYLFLLMSLVLIWNVARREERPGAPSGSLDIFIPVAGEPVEMVERTLQAALAIDYPHETYILNDGVMCRSDNWQDIEDLARLYGVRCFTRRKGRRSKAGNLNYAFDRTNGDFIAVIDADHEAVTFFADETLGYFADHRVGLVATPQRFVLDQADILGNEENQFYSFVQAAKDADGSAFSCGNAAVYRRAALDDTDGFSEWSIVEDLHTSMKIHAQGWESVYHPRPLTVGEAPATGAALAKQRLGWATDSLRILFWDNPLLNKDLSFMQRLHYFHTGFFYIVMLAQLVFMAAPILHVLFGVTILNARSVEDYVFHSAPYMGAVAFLVIAQAGIKGGLRAVQKLIFLAPTFLVAALRAATGRRFASPVTEKARPRSASWLLFPQYIILMLLIVTIAIALVSPGPARAVSAFWAAWMAAAIAIPVLTGGSRGLWRGARRIVRGGVALAAAVAIAVTVGFQADLVTPRGARLARYTATAVEVQATRDQPSPERPQKLVPPVHGAYVGASAMSILEEDGVERWQQKRQTALDIAHWYQPWGNRTRRVRIDWLDMVRKQGVVPMISWEPWHKPSGEVHAGPQRRFRLSRIAVGEFDRYIRSWARGVARYKHPLLIRFAHEMNGYWYPWSVGTNGNSRHDFVQAWRRIHNIFEEEGATNVSWVWAVNEISGLRQDGRDLERLYPGERYVDWVSVTGFNWGTTNSFNRWRTFRDAFGKTLAGLERFEKPIMISEIGTVSTGGNAAGWVRDSLRRLRKKHAEVKAVVWFDHTYPGGVDFRLRGRRGKALASETRRDYWRPTIQSTDAVTGGTSSTTGRSFD